MTHLTSSHDFEIVVSTGGLATEPPGCLKTPLPKRLVMSHFPENPEDCPPGHDGTAGCGRLVILAELSEISLASQWMQEFVVPMKLPENQVARLALVLDEVLSNIILHAFDTDGQHRITIRVEAQPAAVHLDIEDAGRPFNPLEAPPPPMLRDLNQAELGGLGIYLIRRYCDECRYQRIDGMNRLHLTLFAPT